MCQAWWLQQRTKQALSLGGKQTPSDAERSPRNSQRGRCWKRTRKGAPEKENAAGTWPHPGGREGGPGSVPTEGAAGEKPSQGRSSLDSRSGKGQFQLEGHLRLPERGGGNSRRPRAHRGLHVKSPHTGNLHNYLTRLSSLTWFGQRICP